MGRKKQPLKPGPPSQPLRAQGKGGRKRIPTSAFDPAAGAAIAAALEPEKTFTVEKLVASRLKSGVKEFLVRWEGIRRQARFMGTDGEPVQLVVPGPAQAPLP